MRFGMRALPGLAVLTSFLSLLSIAGCGGASSSPVTTTASTFTGVKLSGQVKGIQPSVQPQNGPQPTVQAPITGATIQLYQVGTSSDGSSATPLGSSTTTNSTGGFTLTGDYTCPGSNPLVYLLATGGNPGLAPTTNNTAIKLIAALGPCSSLTSTTAINLTEVTTAAAVAALSPYMTSPSCTTAPICIGSGTSDASALASAFTLASQYANTATGTSPGTSVPAGDAAPSTLINTLADIVSACVNTTGGVAGDGSNCGTLFADSTPSGGAAPTDVATALLNILNNPTSNLNPLFGLLSLPSPLPFTPVLGAAPSSWAISLQTITFNSTLPSGTVGTAYSGSVTANGAQGTTTYSLASGALPASGDLVLNAGTGAITGTPTAADVGTYTFKVKVVDQYGDTATSGTLSIVVNTAGGQISGQVNLQNNCGVSTLPAFTVGLYTSPGGTFVTSTTTNTTSGAYSFNSIPVGTYTITPSISGAESVFSPANYPSVTITNGSNFGGENFNAVVGYTVSGTVGYGGTQTGQTYLYLQNNNCSSNGNPGTSITEATLTGSGAYSIRGVNPGNYTLYAWMDSTGITSGTDYPGPQGAPNTNDPTGNGSSFNVVNGNVTQNVSLANATFAVPPSNPAIQVIPHEGGVLLNYDAPSVSNSNVNNEEAANEYVVNWALATSTDSDGLYCPLGGGTGGAQFLTLAGTHTFYATGEKSNIWILNNTSMGSGSFTAGGTYCFQARAFNTLFGNSSTDHPSGWTTPTDSDGNPQGVTLPTTTVFCTSSCTTVSGTVTIPASVTIATGAPLYVGVYQQTSNSKGPSAIYSYEIPNPVSGANSYSMTIPNGSGYFLFGILDQNNDGVIDAYDVTNTNNNDNSSGFTASGSALPESATLPGTNSTVQVQTQYFTSSGGSSYSLNFDVYEANKLPVSVTLSGTSVATPYVMFPVDISLCNTCGNDQFQYYTNLPGGTPSVGDSFDFTVKYSDGSTESGTTVNGAVTAFGSTGAVVGPSDAATNLQTTAGTTPNFTWNFPASPSSYLYSFGIYQSNCTGSCNNTWQIPGNNSNSNGFTYAETETGATTGQITWGTDPTGGGSTPSGSGLCSGVLCGADDYNWSISVQDSNGNQAQSTASDNNP